VILWGFFFISAALQEVDRQQQADKVRIADLEVKVSIFDSKWLNSNLSSTTSSRD
jgi:hypothetical protein